MIIRQRKIDSLINNGNIYPMYRVLNEFELQGLDQNRYKYYSLTLNHHIHFLVRRIFYLIKQNYSIDLISIQYRYFFEELTKLINYLQSSDDNLSIEVDNLYLDNSLIPILEQNAYLNRNSHPHNVIEKADFTVYEGGYGLKGLWLDLYKLLIYAKGRRIIDKQMIIAYLQEFNKLLNIALSKGIKENYYTTTKLKIASAHLLIKPPQQIEINQDNLNVSNELIEQTLREIIKQDLVKKDTDLDLRPDKTINDFINNCNNNRNILQRTLGR